MSKYTAPIGLTWLEQVIATFSCVYYIAALARKGKCGWHANLTTRMGRYANFRPHCEGTRIHGSFACKHRHHFCAQNFAASPHFIPKIIAAPASMLITMAGTAPGHSSLWPGPHRDTHLWPGPHRDRADTLITIAGAALRRSLLWPGPHRNAVYYGRDRTWTLITMAGTAPGPR